MNGPDSADFNEANHDGRLFTASYIFPTVAPAGEVLIRLQTGAHKVAVAVQVVGDGKIEFTSYGGTTYSNQGTSVPAFNRNAIDPNYPAFSGVVYRSPTVNVLGAQRLNLIIAGGGNNASAVGSISTDDIKTFLPAGADVLVKLVNRMAQNQDISVIVNLADRI